MKAHIETRQGMFGKEYKLLSGRKVIVNWTSLENIQNFINTNNFVRLQSGEYEQQKLQNDKRQ